MKRLRFMQEQVIAAKEHQARAAVADFCRKHGVSDATFCTWRSNMVASRCPTRSV